MSNKVAVFWPGDAREIPNQLALPSMQEATTQLVAALKKLGRDPYLVEGYLSKPHHAIEKLGHLPSAAGTRAARATTSSWSRTSTIRRAGSIESASLGRASGSFD